MDVALDAIWRLAVLELAMLREAPLIWLPFRLIAPPLLILAIRRLVK